MADLERQYNVPLRKGFRNTPKYKKAKKAVATLKLFLNRHMKSDNVLIGKHLNEKIWERGIKNPPHHVRVTAVKDKEGVVKAELEGFKYEVPKPKEEKPEGLMGKLKGKKEEKVEEADSKEAGQETKVEQAKPAPKEDVASKKETSKPSVKKTADDKKSVSEKSK